MLRSPHLLLRRFPRACPRFLTRAKTISTTAAPVPRSSRIPRYLLIAAHATAFTAAGVYVCSTLHPFLRPLPLLFVAGPPTPGPDLLSHPLYADLSSRPDEYSASDAWSTVPPEIKARKLVASTLGLSFNRVFLRRDGRESVSFLGAGAGLSGYPGILHGGVAATLLDEAMGRVAIATMGEGAVTARLECNYKRPVLTPGVIVVRTSVERMDGDGGRKCWVVGEVVGEDGEVAVRGRGLFVRPRGWRPRKLVGIVGERESGQAKV